MENTTWENKVKSVFTVLNNHANKYPDDKLSVEKLPLQKRKSISILSFAGSWHDLDKSILSPKSIQKRRLQSIRKP